MLSYCYDTEFDQWLVINSEGVIFAMFDTEIQAEDYCDRHNAKVTA